MSTDAERDRVTCWACETEIRREDAQRVYRDQQGGLHDRPDGRGLWLAAYLCPECAACVGANR